MAQELVLDSSLEDFKQFARIMYIVHAITFLFSLGMLSFLPLIANYIRRPETQGTLVYTHHGWMIRSFWIYIILQGVSVVLWFTIIGIPLAAVISVVTWIWYAYRLIRGFIDLNSNRPMPG